VEVLLSRQRKQWDKKTNKYTTSCTEPRGRDHHMVSNAFRTRRSHPSQSIRTSKVTF
jgi:hypothetical protein